MVPWIERSEIKIDFARPPERLLEEVPSDAIARGQELLAAVMHEIPRAARFIADLVRLRTWGRFQQEAVLLARQAQASWRHILLANVSYDLLLTTMGCSTIALPTPEGPVVARNMDWWPEGILARSSYVVRCVRGDDLLFVNAGWPGSIGVVTGLSARGFAVVLNAVTGPEKKARTGYPVLLHLRRVLDDAADFEQALKMLSEQKLMAPALITLVGSENHQRVVIERTPCRHALRWAEPDQPLFATNHYRSLYPPQDSPGHVFYQNTCARYATLERFFAGHQADQPVRDEALLYVLSDPQIIQTITAQHIIMRPRSKSVRLFVPRRLVDAAA